MRRVRHRKRELVDLQRRQLRRDQVALVPDVSEAGARCDRELARVVQPVIAEVPDPVHLEVRDERVPVRDRAPTRICVEVDAVEAEGRRDQCRRGFPVRPEALAVKKELRVELARAPAREHLVHRRLVDLQ